jgi:hypothetical protein
MLREEEREVMAETAKLGGDRSYFENHCGNLIYLTVF